MDAGAAPAEPRCPLEPRGPLEPLPAVLCALGALLGLGCGCFGYRCFKAAMFLSGLLLGSAVIFLLCHRQRVLATAPLSLEASAALAAAIGLLCGLLTALLRPVGLFSTGLLLGLLLATAALAALGGPGATNTDPWVGAAAALGLALLCALSALRWPRAVTVLGTAALGAAALVLGADYFAERLQLVAFVLARLRRAPAALCWPGWALLGAWPALGVAAVVLQWKVTAGGDPREAALSRRQKRPQDPQPRPCAAPPEGPPRRKSPPGPAGTPGRHPEPAGAPPGQRDPPGTPRRRP